MKMTLKQQVENLETSLEKSFNRQETLAVDLRVANSKLSEATKVISELKTALHDMEQQLSRTEGYLQRVHEDDELREAPMRAVPHSPCPPARSGPVPGTTVDYGSDHQFYGQTIQRAKWWEW